MTKRILLATAALTLGIVTQAAFAEEKTAADPVVARVSGTEIHRSEVMRELQMMGPQAQQVPPQMIYPQIVQKMIATKLVSVPWGNSRIGESISWRTHSPNPPITF